jgi:hypothetical protein
MSDTHGQAGAGSAGQGAAAGAGSAAGSGANSGGQGGQQGAGQGSGAAQPWYQPLGLDDDQVQFIVGKGLPDIKAAFRSHMDADKMARERNVLPKPDPKALDKWEGWKDLGWKEKLEEYKLTPPANLPQGMENWGALGEVMRNSAHEARVPEAAAQKVFESVMGFFGQNVKDMEAKGASERTKLETDLRKDWGLDYDAKSELAKRAALAFGVGAGDMAELEKITGSPRLLKMFNAIGEKLGEASLPAPGGGSARLTPESAKSKRMALENDPAWFAIFNDQRHPQNAEYVAQRAELLKLEAKGVAQAA